MLAQSNPPAAHAGEDRSSPKTAIAVRAFFIAPPSPDANSMQDLVIRNDWLRAGDVVYITETRRHTLTDADLNAAARAVIGGEA